jgi:thiol-disulfide isomerase/thioredoxin
MMGGGMMRKLALTVLYTAFVLGANIGAAAADVSALLTGDMVKLVMADAPAALPEAELIDMADAPHSLAEVKGKWAVLNFWATWCAPCREEMPSLDRLQAAMPEIAVVLVATGRNDPAAITRLFEEVGMQHLSTWRDPQSQLARGMGILGLPVTVILNPEGQEVGRLIGGAQWDAPEAQALLKALMAEAK